PLMLVLHPCQSMLQLAESIFGSLGGRALHDHATHKRFLFRDTLLSFANVPIRQNGVVRSRHEKPPEPRSENNRRGCEWFRAWRRVSGQEIGLERLADRNP